MYTTSFDGRYFARRIVAITFFTEAWNLTWTRNADSVARAGKAEDSKK